MVYRDYMATQVATTIVFLIFIPSTVIEIVGTKNATDTVRTSGGSTRWVNSKMRKMLQGTNEQVEWTYGHGPEFAGIIVQGHFAFVKANIRIDKPDVQPQHRTSSFVAIENGEGDNYNQIQVGWTVNPDWYGDKEPHFYTMWTVDHNQYCYHPLKCPEFHLYRKGGIFGSVLTPSIIGWTIEELNITLTQDSSGKWGLLVGPTMIGRWDTTPFSTLTKGATTVRLGGEVFTPEDSDSSPPMGSGIFKYGNYYKTGFFSDIEINGQDPQNPQVVESRCYFVAGVHRGSDVPEGFGFSYGGRGGKDQVTCMY